MYNDFERQKREERKIKPGKDPRFKDLGLSEREAYYIIDYCKKFTNIRDTLEDILQEALIGLHEAFSKNPHIRHRMGFIRSVVRNTINARVVRINKKDTIYKSKNDAFLIENFCEGNWTSSVVDRIKGLAIAELNYEGTVFDLSERLQDDLDFIVQEIEEHGR